MNEERQRSEQSEHQKLTYVELDKTATPEEIVAYLRKKGDELLARENSPSEPPGER